MITHRASIWLVIFAFLAALWPWADGRADDAPARDGKRIFFGDLHTHSNLSMDAVLVQVFQGIDRGPEAACTFARACAQVDFYGQSDHAEHLDQERWQRSVDAVKSCNQAAAAAAPAGQEPDLVAFQGFEWTASAIGEYWGHKNVFFRNDAVPEQAIGAYAVRDVPVVDPKTLMSVLGFFEEREITLIPGVRTAARGAKMSSRLRCVDSPAGAPCIRVAEEPRQLFDALSVYYGDPDYVAAGYDAMVIPHGSAWGMAKVATDWDIQLNASQHDPNLQRLVEVYSGHGNSEEYRDYDGADADSFESCYERAGRLMAADCRRRGVSADDCRPQIAEAERTARVPFATDGEDWGRCNQCTDCFQPAEKYDPRGSVQTAMAKTGFGDGTTSMTRYHFGFIAATDDHNSRPASVLELKAFTDWPIGLLMQPTARTDFATPGRNGVEAERIASYLYPGGLVAVHAETRSREAIWDALKRREVYGTSGPRMALWFDATAGDDAVAMGSRLAARTSPTFRVEAWGGPEELPGCSASTRARWGAEVVDDVCLGTCFNPGGQRTGIERIEVVKITPQAGPDEPLGGLIHDPYMVLDNPDRNEFGDAAPRMVTSFSDPAYDRDALYYVRAIQTPTPAVNGTPMQRADGAWAPCPVDAQAQCRSMAAERAWSSPIYIDFQ